MATARRGVVDFMYLNHDEDLVERLRLHHRDDAATVKKAGKVELDLPAYGAEKFPTPSVANNGHQQRVAVTSS